MKNFRVAVFAGTFFALGSSFIIPVSAQTACNEVCKAKCRDVAARGNSTFEACVAHWSRINRGEIVFEGACNENCKSQCRAAVSRGTTTFEACVAHWSRINMEKYRK